jgi:hypothetical protein
VQAVTKQFIFDGGEEAKVTASTHSSFMS